MSVSTVGGAKLAYGLRVRSLGAGPGHRPRRRGRPPRHRFNSVGGYDSGPHSANYSVDAGDLNANVMARTTAHGNALMLASDKGVTWADQRRPACRAPGQPALALPGWTRFTSAPVHLCIVSDQA